jgi:tRNA pseudouridine32 synthase/23S rRNA pseudouridine746 synthase
MPMPPVSAKAAQPSYVVLPRVDNAPATVIDFLVEKFPRIDKSIWYQRIEDEKIHWQDGSIIELNTQYRPAQRVYYYREVTAETRIPFDEIILHQDEHALVVYKPHYLPVTPSGNFVNECLVHRLRIKTGIDTIAPAHRLDRDTAGIVLMTINPQVRHHYHQLFVDGSITKEYQAIAKLSPELLAAHRAGTLSLPMSWTVKNRVGPGKPSFLRQVVQGDANTHSEIALQQVQGELGLFRLSPITGKTHQLRLHMLSLGMPLLNDRFYPTLLDEGPDRFEAPLKLLAQRLRYVDPISSLARDIQCPAWTLETVDGAR